jgi:hypothetical protein
MAQSNKNLTLSQDSSALDTIAESAPHPVREEEQPAAESQGTNTTQKKQKQKQPRAVSTVNPFTAVIAVAEEERKADENEDAAKKHAPAVITLSGKKETYLCVTDLPFLFTLLLKCFMGKPAKTEETDTWSIKVRYCGSHEPHYHAPGKVFVKNIYGKLDDIRAALTGGERKFELKKSHSGMASFLRFTWRKALDKSLETQQAFFNSNQAMDQFLLRALEVHGKEVPLTCLEKKDAKTKAADKATG